MIEYCLQVFEWIFINGRIFIIFDTTVSLRKERIRTRPKNGKILWRGRRGEFSTLGAIFFARKIFARFAPKFLLLKILPPPPYWHSETCACVTLDKHGVPILFPNRWLTSIYGLTTNLHLKVNASFYSALIIGNFTWPGLPVWRLSVCHNFLKVRGVSLQYSYNQCTCSYMYTLEL